MKVFIFDPIWPKIVDKKIMRMLTEADIGITVFSEVKPLSECAELFAGDEDRILCLNPDYVNWQLKNKDYENIPNLKAILIASTGYEWVERGVADERDIPVCNIKNFSTQAVAEWAVMMMTNLARQTPLLIKDNFPLDYDEDFMKYRGTQLKGKTVGIIGLGNIGLAIADACNGLGMEVIYWSRSPKDVTYERKEIIDLMQISDFVFPR